MPSAWESLFDGSLTLSAEKTESCALAELPANRGVALFADRTKRPIQLVQTANLRSISRSRLADTDQTPRRKADLGAITHYIYYACCCNDLERQFLYQRLTHAVFGKDWKRWLTLPRREYAAIDRRRAFGLFTVTNTVQETEGVELFGPFPTRRAATRFCDYLNTAYELCRNPALLDSGNPQSCPYRQMQSCHGLCCREHGEEAYTELVDNAVQCAAGRTAECIARIERRMKQAADRLDFEVAQRFKQQADHLKKLLHPDYEWTGRLSSLQILFIGRGPKLASEGTKKKIQHYQIWRLDAERACLAGVFAPESPEQLRHLLSLSCVDLPAYPYALSRQEHLAAVGYFLYRKSRPGLWFNTAVNQPDVNTLLASLSAAQG